MTEPHNVLGLSPHADEETIRKRYLELVREFPPDRAPERFAAIRAAYDQVRDPSLQLQIQLFEPETDDSLDAIADDLRARLRQRMIPTSVLLSLAEPS
ncbi:MAG: J domain-containing protein [Isosphaeraceae bacterium]